MKRVGILTFHGAHNYGSVLQTYASVMTLRTLGYNPEVINLRNDAQREAYRIFHPGESMVRRLFTILKYPQLKNRFNKFEYFINHVLPVSDKEYRTGSQLDVSSLPYDIYYTGSDQVWNPACQDFESAYYLDFVRHQRPTVAYAPSLGKGRFEEGDRKLIGGLLKNIDYISCREASGARLLSELSGRNVRQVCDPVLLPGRDKWNEFAGKRVRHGKYILAYFLNNNHGDRSQIEALRHTTGLPVVILNDYIRDMFRPGVHQKLDASPQEFVALIRDAEIVYTNSFHATAFSVIFGKKFYTAIAADENVHNNNDSRKIDFLTSVALDDCLIRNGQTIMPDVMPEYEEAYRRLEQMRIESLKYLEDALEGK